MTFTIRTAEPGDKAKLTELMLDYIVGFYRNPGPPIERLHQLIDTLYNKETGIQFVAEKEGELVGFASLFFTYSTMRADRVAVMNDLFVIEAYRESSEAEAHLFQACRSYSEEHGFANMTWITASTNTRAQTFFHKMNALQGKEWVHFSIS